MEESRNGEGAAGRRQEGENPGAVDEAEEGYRLARAFAKRLRCLEEVEDLTADAIGGAYSTLCAIRVLVYAARRDLEREDLDGARRCLGIIDEGALSKALELRDALDAPHQAADAPAAGQEARRP